MHILAEISPLDPVTGTRPTLRVSSAQDRTLNGLNGAKWWPGLLRKPTLGLSLFDGDFSSGVDSGQAALDLSVTALEKLDSNARRFVWAGAVVTLYAGVSGQAWPWTKVFVGRADNFRLQANKLSLTATVDEEPFKAKVLSATYAGTGGLEGGADLKGKPKPWAFGAPQNIEPILIDSINSVFQFSAYGASKAVTTLYERGTAFSASFGNYSDYTALVAANIPAGRWATCLASGLIRLGAPPYGVITADVEGDYNGLIWSRRPGQILQRICSALSISGSLIDTTSLNALDTALSALPSGGNVSIYLTEQQEVLDLARDLAISCNAHAGISWIGQLFTTRVVIGSPVATLDAQQKRMPRVVDNTEIQVSPPYSRIQMGGQRCWRVHSFDEIAFGAELIDKGLYSASVVYRDGNIVSLDDGSRWLFVGATPVAGSAPTDVNTNWSRMTNAVQSAAIAAAQAAAAAAQADADTALTTLTNIASDSLLTPDEKPSIIRDRDAITAEQSGIDAQATAFSITTEKTTYDTAVSALTTYLATLTSPVLWSNLTGNTTIVGTTFRQKFLDVYSSRQVLLNKIASEAAKRADWSLLNGIPYDEIFNSDDDVTLGMNPVFAAWSGSYPDNWSNWVGGAPTKETSIVRVGSNAVRMTASGSDRGIQCDAISFTSTPFPVGTFLSGAVDFYLAARTSGLPGIKIRLYTNSAKSTFVDTDVRPGTTTGTWQRIPWTARVGAAQQIYGIRIYAMASYSSFAGGSFTGDVIFGDIRFGLFDSSTDNKAVAIGADGTLSGAGGGQVTIFGLGYIGDLNATRNVSRGAWSSASVAYAIGDVVDRNGSSYSCVAAHTSTAGNGPPGANWTLLAQVGSTGQSTDVIYKKSATQPSTPAASSGVPSGWYGTVSSLPAGNDPIWVSFGVKAVGGTTFTWQTPVAAAAADLRLWSGLDVNGNVQTDKVDTSAIVDDAILKQKILNGEIGYITNFFAADTPITSYGSYTAPGTFSGGHVVFTTPFYTVGDASGGAVQATLYATFQTPYGWDPAMQMWLVSDTGSGWNVAKYQQVYAATLSGDTYASIPIAITMSLSGIQQVRFRLFATNYNWPGGTVISGNSSLLANINLTVTGLSR